MPIRQKSRVWTTHHRLEATSRNEASRDEKHFVVIAIFFLILFKLCLTVVPLFKKGI